MPRLMFEAMPSRDAEAIWSGLPDAYGLMPERLVSDGDGVPCRHCLQHVKGGEAYLVFAYKPFRTLQPYAETGPVFLHAGPCPRYADENTIPPILLSNPDYIVRGYGHDDRIVYGTGAVVEADRIEESSAALLDRGDIAYVHVRSARNNCYQCRIARP